MCSIIQPWVMLQNITAAISYFLDLIDSSVKKKLLKRWVVGTRTGKGWLRLILKNSGRCLAPSAGSIFYLSTHSTTSESSSPSMIGKNNYSHGKRQWNIVLASTGVLGSLCIFTWPQSCRYNILPWFWKKNTSRTLSPQLLDAVQGGKRVVGEVDNVRRSWL